MVREICVSEGHFPVVMNGYHDKYMNYEVAITC